MSLLSLPNEILLPIGQQLETNDLFSLMMTSVFLSRLFVPVLHEIAFKDHENLPCLHWAVSQGHYPLVRLILSRGVDVNSSNNFNLCTPLMLAAKFGYKDIVKLLLKKGADIDARDIDGNTALIQAIRHSKIGVCRTLLAAGAGDDSVAYCRTRGFLLKSSALHWAVSMPFSNNSLIRLMLSNGADVNRRDCIGGTALHRAMGHQNYGVIQMLIDHGVDLNAQDHNFCTALHKAIWDSKLVRMLVRHGADMEIPNRYGETALRLAVSTRREPSVKVLLEYGADASVKDGLGESLVSLAERDSLTDIATLLMNHLDITRPDSGTHSPYLP